MSNTLARELTTTKCWRRLNRAALKVNENPQITPISKKEKSYATKRQRTTKRDCRESCLRADIFSTAALNRAPAIDGMIVETRTLIVFDQISPRCWDQPNRIRRRVFERSGQDESRKANLGLTGQIFSGTRSTK
jgi:hypothetical protein